MWEVKFKLGIFRQKPSFLSRVTFLSRATLHKKLSVGLLRSQELLSLMRELFWVYSCLYSEPNLRIDWKLLGFQACPDFSTVLSWPTMWRGGEKPSCQQQLVDSNLKKHFTFLPSSAEVPSAWTVDESWCIVGELYPQLKFSLSTISTSMMWGKRTQSGLLTLKRNATRCGSCCTPKLPCHSHGEW